MGSYETFAKVYDDFMDNIPYEQWAEYMIGIDNSIEMLEIAKEKSIGKHEDILYLFQDMREFELYGTVRGIVSICDSMNYILEKEDLTKVMRLVNNYLDPGGIFIFDMNTPYKYETILADNTIAEDRDGMSFIWDNYFYEEERINEYSLHLFLQGDDGRYDKFTETHYQKAYEIEQIKEAIENGGLEFVGVYDAFTKDPPRENSERLYFIAREKGKVERIRDGRLHY